MNSLGSRSLWLLAKVEAGRMSIMITGLSGGRTALPVFSFEDEAGMFRELAAPRAGWRVRETAAGELVSVLLGPCAGVSRIFLDPLPGPDGGVPTDLAGLVEMDREAFVALLLDRKTVEMWQPSCRSN